MLIQGFMVSLSVKYLHYLDLVAVSIASDIVPITGENRVMAYFGLKSLNESPRTGLKEIIRESEVTKATYY